MLLVADKETDLARFKTYVQRIGKGKRAGKTLTQSEAYDAMSLLLANRVTAEQRGAFLMLLRVREETADEIAGFLQACREYTVQWRLSHRPDLDLGCYAGKRRHLPWVILAAFCLAQSGKRVFLHGTAEPDSHRLYVHDALTQLGFSKAQNAAQLNHQLAQSHMGLCDLSTLNPALSDIIQLRAQLGLRSCANTLARMLNPLSASASLQGIYHHGIEEKHALVSERLNDPNVLVFRGDSGEVERNPERESIAIQVRYGQRQTTVLPVMNHDWVTKPKSLDTQVLISVWNGHTVDRYGNAALIGTLALMLMATDQLDHDSALHQAQLLWDSRDIEWLAHAMHCHGTIAQPMHQHGA